MIYEKMFKKKIIGGSNYMTMKVFKFIFFRELKVEIFFLNRTTCFYLCDFIINIKRIQRSMTT